MPPCLNCILIEMGEMACYQERCPQCGRIPPGRRLQPAELSKQTAARKYPKKQYINPAQRTVDQASKEDMEGFVQRNSFSKEYKQRNSYSMESISARTGHQLGSTRFSSDCNV